jgi:hypothetical protein
MHYHLKFFRGSQQVSSPILQVIVDVDKVSTSSSILLLHLVINLVILI